jgi:hypothetical protein
LEFTVTGQPPVVASAGVPVVKMFVNLWSFPPSSPTKAVLLAKSTNGAEYESLGFPLNATVVMQGIGQPLYDAGASDVGATGAVRVPVDAFHLTRTRLATPPELLWTKATWKPSSERTTELKTVPDVL